jgi:hypothetical protein
MRIVEREPHRVITDRMQLQNLHVAFAADDAASFPFTSPQDGLHVSLAVFRLFGTATINEPRTARWFPDCLDMWS